MDSECTEIEGNEGQHMEVERQAISLSFLVSFRKNRICLERRKNA